MSLFGDGMRWNTPGAAVSGRRVFVRTPDRYEPDKKMNGQIKRVSDLVYEKASR
jgi:hypothetical protein